MRKDITNDRGIRVEKRKPTETSDNEINSFNREQCRVIGKPIKLSIAFIKEMGFQLIFENIKKW